MTKSAAKAALKPNEKPTAKSTLTIAPAAIAPKASAPVAIAPKASAPAAIAPKASTPAAAAPKASTPAAIAPKASVSGPSAPAASAALTIIDVKRDVGFGNAVFLRGQGAGLTWERGLPLVCVDGKTWRWTGIAKDPIRFKLLINDTIWSAGNDLTIAPGQKLEVAPEFA